MKLVANKHQAVGALIAGLATLAPWSEPAEASPPSPRGAPLTRVAVEAPPSSGAVRSGPALGRLDLRAPPDFAAARAPSDCGWEPTDSGSVPFPSARRASKSGPIEEQPMEPRLPSLAGSGRESPRLEMQNASRAEELTRRVHREGLPVARLWETRSALVSLGLSPRGKPGIWLIQKVP